LVVVRHNFKLFDSFKPFVFSFKTLQNY
jgi:hypothetical protein